MARTARLQFSFVGGQGHFDPLVPIARAAARAHHEVEFACRASMVSAVQATGFEARPVGPDVPDPVAITPLLEPDSEREDQVLRDGLANRTARIRARQLLELWAGRRPDVVVADEVDYGALIAAEVLGIPCATVIVIAAGGFTRPDLLRAPLDEVRRAFGLPPDPELAMLGRYLEIAPEPPRFRDPDFPLGPRPLWIRPSALEPVDATAATWPSGGDRLRVYATLGTVFNMESGDLFDRILEAVTGLRADVMMTVGRQLDPRALGPPPSHVRIDQLATHSDVFATADLVISHGGSGTVIGALAHGVPQLVLPIGADQPHNARRCEALGIGRALDPVRASAGDIREVAESLLADSTVRQNAAVMAAEARALPGPEAAVTAIEGLSVAG
jgi:UDP:flavonoid glycosyltransferase YjiC (YdhE family)